MIATQFGLAMMPRCEAIAPAFTSGTTSGTPASMRNAEELSTTTAPCATAAGANRRAVPLPAENSAISAPARPSSVSNSTGSPSPRNISRRPAERGEAIQAQGPKREITLLEAGDQFAADGASGTDNRDRGMVQAHDTAFLHVRPEERVARNAKAPSVTGGAYGLRYAGSLNTHIPGPPRRRASWSSSCASSYRTFNHLTAGPPRRKVGNRVRQAGSGALP